MFPDNSPNLNDGQMETYTDEEGHERSRFRIVIDEDLDEIPPEELEEDEGESSHEDEPTTSSQPGSLAASLPLPTRRTTSTKPGLPPNCERCAAYRENAERAFDLILAANERNRRHQESLKQIEQLDRTLNDRVEYIGILQKKLNEHEQKLIKQTDEMNTKRNENEILKEQLQFSREEASRNAAAADRLQTTELALTRAVERMHELEKKCREMADRVVASGRLLKNMNQTNESNTKCKQVRSSSSSKKPAKHDPITANLLMSALMDESEEEEEDEKEEDDENDELAAVIERELQTARSTTNSQPTAFVEAGFEAEESENETPVSPPTRRRQVGRQTRQTTSRVGSGKLSKLVPLPRAADEPTSSPIARLPTRRPRKRRVGVEEKKAESKRTALSLESPKRTKLDSRLRRTSSRLASAESTAETKEEGEKTTSPPAHAPPTTRQSKRRTPASLTLSESSADDQPTPSVESKRVDETADKAVSREPATIRKSELKVPPSQNARKRRGTLAASMEEKKPEPKPTISTPQSPKRAQLIDVEQAPAINTRRGTRARLQKSPTHATKLMDSKSGRTRGAASTANSLNFLLDILSNLTTRRGRNQQTAAEAAKRFDEALVRWASTTSRGAAADATNRPSGVEMVDQLVRFVRDQNVGDLWHGLQPTSSRTDEAILASTERNFFEFIGAINETDRWPGIFGSLVEKMAMECVKSPATSLVQKCRDFRVLVLALFFTETHETGVHSSDRLNSLAQSVSTVVDRMLLAEDAQSAVRILTFLYTTHSSFFVRRLLAATDYLAAFRLFLIRHHLLSAPPQTRSVFFAYIEKERGSAEVPFELLETDVEAVETREWIEKAQLAVRPIEQGELNVPGARHFLTQFQKRLTNS